MRKRGPFCGVAAAAVVAAVLLSAVAARGQATARRELFGASRARLVAVAADPSVTRSRAAFLRMPLLATVEPGERLVLNLFDDTRLVMDVEGVERSAPDRLHLWGRIEGDGGGRVNLVRRSDVVTGLIQTSGVGTYRLRFDADGPGAIGEIDEDLLPGCGNGQAHSVAGGGGGGGVAAAGGGPCDDGTVIDLLVLYTALARSAIGSTAAMEAEIDLAVAASNDAYENSNIVPRLNLVHTALTSYNELGTYEDHLFRLTDPADGIMDEAHTLRDLHDADMVALLVQDNEFCGVAWIMRTLSPDFESSAFSVTTWFCAANLILAHELGHNMGSCHAPGDGGGCQSGGLYFYSLGHRFFGNSGTQWRTVMAYAPGNRITHFSNPQILFDGQPTGVSAEEAGSAENARTINETALVISQFRCSIPTCQEGRLHAADGQAGDEFGWSVSVSGDVALVGAPKDEGASGAVFLYRDDGTGWPQEAKVVASDGAPGHYFGRSVAIDANTAIVGAYGDDDNGAASGSAYVEGFDGASWVEQAKLLASDGAAGDLFGSSVSISGDVALVGAPNHDPAVSDAGAAYVYRFNGAGWVQEAQLLASDGATGDLFGTSVSISGDVALVGAPNHDAAASDAGASYVYRFDGSVWAEQAKLTASDGAASDSFGSSVAATGNAVIVGAWKRADAGLQSGAAYVYQFDGLSWSEEAKILASDRADNDGFGRSVALDANVACVGAYGVDDNGATSGAIYVYRRAGSSWFEEAKLHASDHGVGDRFGLSVALSGDVAIAGAFSDDDLGTSSGSAEVLLGPNGFDCNNNGVSDACDILYGLSFDGNGDGIPDECACIWDMDSSGSVDVPDLLALLAAWGTNPAGPPDFDNDGLVGVPDLLALLSNWGPCP